MSPAGIFHQLFRKKDALWFPSSTGGQIWNVL